jgi:hypothetical protein
MVPDASIAFAAVTSTRPRARLVAKIAESMPRAAKVSTVVRSWTHGSHQTIEPFQPLPLLPQANYSVLVN